MQIALAAFIASAFFFFTIILAADILARFLGDE